MVILRSLKNLAINKETFLIQQIGKGQKIKVNELLQLKRNFGRILKNFVGKCFKEVAIGRRAKIANYFIKDKVRK